MTFVVIMTSKFVTSPQTQPNAKCHSFLEEVPLTSLLTTFVVGLVNNVRVICPRSKHVTFCCQWVAIWQWHNIVQELTAIMCVTFVAWVHVRCSRYVNFQFLGETSKYDTHSHWRKNKLLIMFNHTEDYSEQFPDLYDEICRMSLFKWFCF